MEKNDRFVEFQQKFEKKKWNYVWNAIIMVCAFIVTGYLMSRAWSETGKTALIMFLMIMCGCALAYFGFIEPLKTSDLIKTLQETVVDEQGALDKLVEQYPIITACKIGEIPQDLMEAAQLLFFDPDYSPQQVIDKIKEDIKDKEVWISVYENSSETNFWQYLKTFKWMILKNKSVQIALA